MKTILEQMREYRTSDGNRFHENVIRFIEILENTFDVRRASTETGIDSECIINSIIRRAVEDILSWGVYDKFGYFVRNV